MKKLHRFAKLYANGIKTLWSCEAHWFVKTAAFPMMCLLTLALCVLDAFDKEENENH